MNEVEKLIDDGLVVEAAKKALKLQGDHSAELWRIVHKQLHARRYDRASRFVEELQLGVNDPQRVAEFVIKCLQDCQFPVAIKWSQTLKGQRPNPYDCVAVAIQRDYVELALKYIAELNLEGFDIAPLIDRLCQQENLTAARKYSQRFDLDTVFTSEFLLERMFQSCQWDNALALINQIPKLKASYTGLKFLERIVQSRDWVSSIKFASQFGIPIKSSNEEPLNASQRAILTMMIQGMIRDGKLYQAMRQVITYQFQAEFPPQQLIKTMINERQYAHAIRFINYLKMQEEFASEITKMHKERMRELVEFRGLMSSRKKIVRSRPNSSQVEPTAVVATIFLGSRTFVKRPDGKLLLASSYAASTAPTSELAAVSAKDVDEDEEEIIFSATPSKKVSQQRHNQMMNMAPVGAQTPFHPMPPVPHPMQSPMQHMPAMQMPRPPFMMNPGPPPVVYAPQMMQLNQSMNVPHFPPQAHPPHFAPGVPIHLPMLGVPHQTQHLIGVKQQQYSEHQRQQTIQKQHEMSHVQGDKKSQQKKIITPSQLF